MRTVLRWQVTWRPPSVLPSHGAAYAVLLLAAAVRRAERHDVEDWVHAARYGGGFLAGAVDLVGPARSLIREGLVSNEGTIRAECAVSALPPSPDRHGMLAAARLLLSHDPPPWLPAATSGGTVRREYIPSEELRVLQWIEPGLNQLLSEVADVLPPRDAAFLARLGTAAELHVLDCLRREGLPAVHVAAISDSYGYDVEVEGPPRRRIEVKAASVRTAGSFHISRNEFDKAARYGDEWELWQVTFNRAAFVGHVIDRRQVVSCRRLRSGAVLACAPADTASFRWMESALLVPEAAYWTSAP